MPDQQEVVIVDAKGTEHVFPPGFDPVKAASIVRGNTEDFSRFGPMQGILQDQAQASSKPRLSSLLPFAGGTVGAVGGATGGPLGVVAGATLGGAAGESGRQLIDRAMGRPAPTTSLAAAQDIGVEGAIQGGGALLGEGATRAMRAVAPALKDVSERMVRAAIKPTVSAMKQIAGAAYSGLDAQAAKLARFIINKRLTTPEKALQVIKEAEVELRSVITAQDTVVDAPTRALRYLDALERSASKQALPAEDVAAIRNAAAEVLQGPMGEDVITMVSRPHPSLVGVDGKPISVLVPQTTRALRSDVMASESLDSARASSKWGSAKVWGEQKGATVEAGKAVQRAQRDAVKEGIPDAKPILRREGQAIQAKEVLDRMKFRQSNRDVVSLPATVMAAGEIASGGKPVLAFASNWLRNNQMKAGIWADRLRTAITNKDVQGVTTILSRLGVTLASQ